MVGGIGVIGGIGFGFSGLLGRFFRELVACFADPWGYCFDLLGGLWGNLGPWRGIWRARGTLECIVERAWKSFVSFEKC